jgi:hypothetical protein
LSSVPFTELQSGGWPDIREDRPQTEPLISNDYTRKRNIWKNALCQALESESPGIATLRRDKTECKRESFASIRHPNHVNQWHLNSISVKSAISLYHPIGTEPSSKLYHLREGEKDGLKDLADSLPRVIPRNIPERSVYPIITLEDGDKSF